MKKWFWSGVTWAAALTALTLWFGAGLVETDIAERSAAALAPYAWANFDIDGRDVTVKGMAPDPDAQQVAVAALRQVKGVRDVSDLTTVLPVAAPYDFRDLRNGGDLILSGSIPDNDTLDAIVGAAESAFTSGSVDDEMALARGDSPDFLAGTLFILPIAAKLDDADIVISDRAVTIRGTGADEGVYQQVTATLGASLPAGLRLETVDIARR